MRHYCCRGCEALFAAESVDDRTMPTRVHCIFCGSDAKAFDSLYAIQGVRTSKARAERIAERAA